jgi:hypothetical protein
MPKLSAMLVNRRTEPRFSFELPEPLYTDNWIMVEGQAYDLLSLLRYYGWSAFEAAEADLAHQEQELDYHEMEIEDDRSFYMAADGGANWIVGAMREQTEHVKASQRVLHVWGYYRDRGDIELTKLEPPALRLPRRPRQTRPDRIKVQTLAEAIPACTASKEEVARWRQEQATPLGPEAPVHGPGWPLVRD